MLRLQNVAPYLILATLATCM